MNNKINLPQIKNNHLISWLLASNPWTKYRTLIDLLDQSETSIIVQNARKALCTDPRVLELAGQAADWLSWVPKRNNDPKISYFKLRILADFGLNIKDNCIKKIIPQIIEHTEGDMFAVPGALPHRPKKGEKYKEPDPGTDEWHASPCNSTIITSILLQLKFHNQKVQKTIARLKEYWSNKEGWFCHFFFVDSLFKKLHIGCPMAGLQALEVFSRIPELKESVYAKNAFEPIRFHKDYGKTMYYFGRAKRFWTLKYPFIWYNALYLAEVLTRFDFLKGNELVRDLIDWIEVSQNKQGMFKPTSMFMIYKDWDFGNKKEPSPWITFLCLRILKRWYGEIPGMALKL